jgi:hypothetical protein
MYLHNGRNMFQMAIVDFYNNLFHSKALQNLPKLGFFVWKYTMWQHWTTHILGILICVTEQDLSP